MNFIGMKTFLIRCTLVSVFLFGGIALRAEDLGAVKARISQRQPNLDTLRKQGVIGENNRGFTEVKKAQGDAAAVSEAENRDRQVVYSEIAKQTKSDADQVGRARARQIAANSTAGVWLQRDSGEWYQK